MGLWNEGLSLPFRGPGNALLDGNRKLYHETAWFVPGLAAYMKHAALEPTTSAFRDPQCLGKERPNYN